MVRLSEKSPRRSRSARRDMMRKDAQLNIIITGLENISEIKAELEYSKFV